MVLARLFTGAILSPYQLLIDRPGRRRQIAPNHKFVLNDDFAVGAGIAQFSDERIGGMASGQWAGQCNDEFLPVAFGEDRSLNGFSGAKLDFGICLK